MNAICQAPLKMFSYIHFQELQRTYQTLPKFAFVHW